MEATTNKKKPNLKAITAISFVIVFGLAIFGFIAFWLLQSLSSAINPPQPKALPATELIGSQPETKSRVVATSSSPSRFQEWQTYRNEKLRYTFQYPVELSPQAIALDNSFDNVVMNGRKPGYERGYSVFVQAQATSQKFASIEAYLQDKNSGQKPSNNLTDYAKTQVAGLTAYQYVFPSEEGVGDLAIYFLNNNRIFKLGYNLSEPVLHYDAQEVLDKIVSTLQFY